jgi:Zn-dependent metalloprotease
LVAVLVPAGLSAGVPGPAVAAARPARAVQPAAAAAASSSAAPAASGPDLRATEAAQALVADRPGELRAGPDDAYVRQPAESLAGWQYVPYERTYRGLPVLGGDFVVVVDPGGDVSSVSVAQKTPISGLDVEPAVAREAAERIATGRLAPGVALEGVRGSRLVVDATGAEPRLAWESLVAGRGPDGPSLLEVVVDAVAGTVVRVDEQVAHDVGRSGFNGGQVEVPSVRVACETNCGSTDTFVLGNPAGGGMTCNASKEFGPGVREWGDGDPTHQETACVDAMYASGVENAMLGDWLGRRGITGNHINGGFAVITDASIGNDVYWIGGPSPQVRIGRRHNGVWWATLDVVGHENGHGIDDATPGGFSHPSTREFIADAFGLATEWYANRPAPFDTPDYVMGDTEALQLDGALKRYLYSPWCYGVQVPPDAPPHDAAGVGDHWLYLLAEGSSPVNGQPSSATCNGSVVTGVGLRTTMQILYGAMLMKTSDSTYLSYRVWTLNAAQNLFPGNCVLLNTVRRAWDAVGVPPQPGEPACVPDLSGMAEQTAHNTMVAGRLNVGSTTRRLSLEPAGTVIGQDLAPGTSVPAGTRVNLTVSLGAAQIPNVLRSTCAAASTTIRAAGLVPACTGTGPKVTSQSPLAGAWLPPGGVVTLTLSNVRTVPDVRGETCAGASAILQSADLNPTCTGNGTVTRATPSIGDSVTVGTLVRLTLSTSPPPSPPECPGSAINCP